LALVALTPAVCEEALFRGPILRGFLSRVGPAAAAVMTGLLFGIFHIELSRILPTALLGILLSQIALQAGSILPSMLAHFLNNACLITMAYLGIDERVPELGTTASLLLFVASAAVTGLGLFMLRSDTDPPKL
jgi:membrane protease YdiL (CAAX protease family)